MTQGFSDLFDKKVSCSNLSVLNFEKACIGQRLVSTETRRVEYLTRKVPPPICPSYVYFNGFNGEPVPLPKKQTKKIDKNEKQTL